jgi:hypothetical protein
LRVWQPLENVSTWLGDWSIVTIIDNTVPPRDPNDDDDDAEDEDNDTDSDGLMPSGPVKKCPTRCIIATTW